jgi:thiopeptide-type bacteriocin biosynthesis protein
MTAPARGDLRLVDQPPRDESGDEAWVDVGLSLPASPGDRDVYAAVSRTTAGLRAAGLVDLSFFVHKPPGLRWRCHLTPGSCPDAVTAAMAAGVRPVAGPAARLVYEPQQALFGGGRSMQLVHRTWDADSTMWLSLLAAGPCGRRVRWTTSLSALTHVLRALGVVGWEDRDVWDRVVRDTGRRLAEQEWARPQVQALAAALRAEWAARWPADDGTAPPAPPAVHDFAAAAVPPLELWREECGGRAALDYSLTPRRVAALWTVFHWNRAGLAGAHQALAAQTLAGRLLAADAAPPVSAADRR